MRSLKGFLERQVSDGATAKCPRSHEAVPSRGGLVALPVCIQDGGSVSSKEGDLIGQLASLL